MVSSRFSFTVRHQYVPGWYSRKGYLRCHVPGRIVKRLLSLVLYSILIYLRKYIMQSNCVDFQADVQVVALRIVTERHVNLVFGPSHCSLFSLSTSEFQALQRTKRNQRPPKFKNITFKNNSSLIFCLDLKLIDRLRKSLGILENALQKSVLQRVYTVVRNLSELRCKKTQS